MSVPKGHDKSVGGFEEAANHMENLLKLRYTHMPGFPRNERLRVFSPKLSSSPPPDLPYTRVCFRMGQVLGLRARSLKSIACSSHKSVSSASQNWGDGLLRECAPVDRRQAANMDHRAHG